MSKEAMKLAREAGGTEMQAYDYGARPDRFIMTHESIERLVELVRADERNSWPAEMEAMERQVNILTDALAEQPAPAAPVQEPWAWLFQHEETGLTQCVDTQQVEWGFEKNNPRWQKIAPLYTFPQAPKENQS